MTGNFSLRDEIREYWSLRAQDFDAQPGHGIRRGDEKRAWLNMLSRQLGDANGRKTLDLACGTGEISHLLHDFGLDVTGLDWSEAMLAIARKKSLDRNSGIRFLTGDAENTRESEATYDLIVTRHLVWTLVDPKAAFQHWHSLLKPGGVLLIIDGDFCTVSLFDKILGWFSARTSVAPEIRSDPKMQALHKSILSRVYFSGGAKAGQVTKMLEDAEFAEISAQTDIAEIKRAQAKEMRLFDRLKRLRSHRYVIRAQKAL